MLSNVLAQVRTLDSNKGGETPLLSLAGYGSPMTSLKTGNWGALRDHVKSARAKLRMNQRELAEAAGVSFSTIQSIERAEPHTRIPDSVPKIELALGWEPGTGRRLVEGDEGTAPTELPPMDESAESRFRAALEAAAPLTRAERRRLFAHLFDSPGPTAG